MSPEKPALDSQRTHTAARPLQPEAVSTVDGVAANGALDTTAGHPLGKWPLIPGYAITGEIARGGMGRVLAARELALDREVAIKVLLAGADPERFLTESKITARLPHPSIPPVHALGHLGDGSPYLAMQLIRGRTLSSELKARPDLAADLPRFVQIFEQIAHAVGFAHAQGIIHRDLKPANVMLGAHGEVQVMDWGLAKQIATDDIRAVPSGGAPDGSAELTAAGAVLGTPAYMAPEQARGEAVGTQTDVFALGGVLTTILTGKAVFSSDSAVETIRQAASGDVAGALGRLRACGADPELIAIAERCLNPVASERPADGLTVAKLVADYRQGVDTRLRQAETDRATELATAELQRKRRRAVRAAAGIIAAVLLTGTAVSMWQADRAGREARRADAEAGEAHAQKVLAQTKAEEAKVQAARAELEAANAKNQARRAETVVGLTTDLFRTSDPTGFSGVGLLPVNRRSRNLTIAELLVRGNESIADKLKDDPLARAALLDVLGDVNRSVGNKALARQYLEESHRLRAQNLPPDHADVAASRFHLANWHTEQGDGAEGLRLYQQLLDWHTGRGTLETLAGAELRLRYSVALITYGDPRGEELARLGGATRERLLGRNHRDTVIARLVLSTSLFDQMKAEEGTAIFLEAFQVLMKDSVAANDPIVLAVMEYQRALVVGALSPALAEAGMKKSCEHMEAALGAEHVYLAILKFDYAQILHGAGKAEAAELAYRESLAIVRKTVGVAHPRAAKLVRGFADFLWHQKKRDQAWELVDEAYRAVVAHYPDDDRWRFGMTCLHGQYAGMVHKSDVARRDVACAFQAARKLDRPLTASEAVSLVNLANGIGYLPDVAHVRECYAMFDAPGAPRLPKAEVQSNLSNYGSILYEHGQYDEAEAVLRKALDATDARNPNASPNGYAHANLGRCLWRKGQFDEAEKLLRTALKYEKRAKDTEAVAEVLNSLVGLLASQQRWADAASALEQYADLPGRTPLNRARVIPTRVALAALTDRPQDARNELPQLENAFGNSTDVNIALYRARAVLLGGGDVHRERQRLAALGENERRLATVVEAQACCDLLLGDAAAALAKFKQYQVPKSSAVRHRKHQLLTAYAAECAGSTPETRRALNDELIAVEQAFGRQSPLKEPAISGYDVSHLAELNWWCKRIRSQPPQ